MSSPLLVPLPGNEAIASALARHLGGQVLVPSIRSFPDGEVYLRLDMDLHGRTVAIVCTLDRPDNKALRLLFAARTVHELGAASIGLVAPYLAYMRQDRRFQPGEAVTARLFASILSPYFDWLVSVDPHLHRIRALDEIYDIPNKTVHAAPAIARWIGDNVSIPVLVGPDSESVQWVSDVAKMTGAPVITLNKTRLGDTTVRMEGDKLSRWRSHTPVLVDDIISTASTMIETIRMLREAGLHPPVCIAVHAIFSNGAYEALRAAAPSRIVTTNTVAHETNGIDITPLLAHGIAEMAPQ